MCCVKAVKVPPRPTMQKWEKSENFHSISNATSNQNLKPKCIDCLQKCILKYNFLQKWCEALSYCEADGRSDPPALFYKFPPSTQHNSPTKALHPCPKRTIGLQYMTIHTITSDLPSACSRAASKPSKSRLAQPQKNEKNMRISISSQLPPAAKFWS